LLSFIHDGAPKGSSMQPKHLSVKICLQTLGLAVLALTACDTEPADDALRDGELLFDLSEDEVVHFHDTYVPEDDFDLTRARLTAPFDCGLFDDFCAQVGPEAAIEITARQVELSRSGAPLEEMNSQTHAWIVEAMDAYDAPDEGEEFRSSGAWAIRTKGDDRLKVRNGVSSPVSGDREAWTESKFQHEDVLGVWWATNADQLCVNTGTNTQTFETSSSPEQVIESENPSNHCISNDGSHKRTTFHSRNNGWDTGLGWWGSYTITANGCGSADHDGVHFGICANPWNLIF
jgi:hypothetical protein